MSVTVTLTPALAAGTIYALGFVLLLVFTVGNSISFTNPRYHEDVLVSLAWPLVFIQLAILAPIFDFYIIDALRDLKEWWEQYQCDHENISEGSGAEINGRVAEEICRDCGKTWWEE